MNETVEKLLEEASGASGKAHCPYSGYRVGAALLTSSGRIFRECNIENVSYGLTVCAERAALFAAVAEGYREFTALAVVAVGGDKPSYPCGACRQVIAEFCGSDFVIYTAPAGRLGNFEELRLGDLMPKPFRLGGG